MFKQRGITIYLFEVEFLVEFPYILFGIVLHGIIAYCPTFIYILYPFIYIIDSSLLCVCIYVIYNQ